MATTKQAEVLAAALSIVEALNFYANPDSYYGLVIIPDHPCGQIAYDTSRLTEQEQEYYVDYRDGHSYHGKRARDALAAWRKAMGE
jgi:hypothetical protein